MGAGVRRAAGVAVDALACVFATDKSGCWAAAAKR